MPRNASPGDFSKGLRPERLSIPALFLFMILSLGLVIALVWFLSSGKYLSALLCLLGALALSHATGRLVVLAVAARER